MDTLTLLPLVNGFSVVIYHHCSVDYLFCQHYGVDILLK